MSGAYQLSTEAITQEIGGETVILDLRSEQYFSLDEVGTRVWQLTGEGHSLAQIIDLLEQEYEVSRQVLVQDVRSLLDDLVEAGLVSGPQEE